MGVYIKGLKLPSAERQGELLILTDDGRCVDMFSGEYEAVELQPHGDLIDRDALLASENQHYEIHSDSFYVESRTIELAPTIIGEEGQ